MKISNQTAPKGMKGSGVAEGEEEDSDHVEEQGVDIVAEDLNISQTGKMRRMRGNKTNYTILARWREIF